MHISRWQPLQQYKCDCGMSIGISYWVAVMLYTAVMTNSITNSISKARFLIVLLAIVLPAIVLPGQAQASLDVRDRLQGMEWSLIALDWHSIPQESVAELSRIALSKQEMSFLRGRALEVLSILPGELANQTFVKLIEQNDEAVLRRRAVDCLCQSDTGMSLEPLLLPLLAEEDQQLRVRVAACLGKRGFDSEDGANALDTYIKNAEPWELRASGLKRGAE
jgi:hypothetical protein